MTSDPWEYYTARDKDLQQRLENCTFPEAQIVDIVKPERPVFTPLPVGYKAPPWPNPAPLPDSVVHLISMLAEAGAQPDPIIDGNLPKDVLEGMGLDV